MTRTSSRLATAVLALGLLLAATTGASAFALNDLIVNGTFGDDTTPSLASWTLSGTTAAQASTSLTNTGTGNLGFNSFFASAFGLLGDSVSTGGGANGAGGIDGNQFQGTSSISQSFVLPGTFSSQTVASYNLTLNFSSVFDGRDNTTADTFTVTLQRTDIAAQPLITLYSPTSAPLATCGPAASPTCSDLQISQNPFTQSGGSLAGLLPGTYALTFTLVEATGNPTNTAVGLDNIDIDAVGTFSTSAPSTLMVVLLGLTGLGAWRLRRRGTPA